MDEFTMAFSCDVFLRKKRWKDRHGFQNEMQKNELELHSFEEEYEKVSTVFTRWHDSQRCKDDMHKTRRRVSAQIRSCEHESMF